jgi:cytochrome c oxidase subunit II
VFAAAAVLSTVACYGPASVLTPAGGDAADVAALFWWMAGVAFVIWLAVTALAVYAVLAPPVRNPTRLASPLIAGAGVALPTVLLAMLLIFGLPMLARMVDGPGSPGEIGVDVTAEQWWWRVRYRTPSGPVELANEIRLPLGRRMLLRLTSDDVIHSFWIPSIAGKVDMIPGRSTHLSLEPTRTGSFVGVCAEYCGTSHARMAFRAVVLEPAAFERWLANEARPARPAVTASGARGRDAFFSNGCAACHAIRGTPAAGVIGPDLTHLGGRLTVAASLPNDAAALVDWIAHPDHAKPGANMPSFAMLPRDEIAAIAAYLSELR